MLESVTIGVKIDFSIARYSYGPLPAVARLIVFCFVNLSILLGIVEFSSTQVP